MADATGCRGRGLIAFQRGRSLLLELLVSTGASVYQTDRPTEMGPRREQAAAASGESRAGG